uniref:Uncharacterized protein n=2 Tax=viral metagenome TaxID=1070528 RepID=A0A6M3LRQ9_9ZZZZ
MRMRMIRPESKNAKKFVYEAVLTNHTQKYAFSKPDMKRIFAINKLVGINNKDYCPTCNLVVTVSMDYLDPLKFKICDKCDGKIKISSPELDSAKFFHMEI